MPPPGQAPEPVWIDALDPQGKPTQIDASQRAEAETAGFKVVAEPIRTQEPRVQHPFQLNAHDYGHALQEGLTSGYGGELASAARVFADAARGKPTGRPAEHGGGRMDDFRHYNQALDARAERAAKSYPGRMGAMNLLGGIAQGYVMPGMGLASKGEEIGRRMLTGGLQGAVEGGITGFGSATGDMNDRANGMAWGTGIGGVTGMLMPVAGAGVRNVAQRTLNALPNLPYDLKPGGLAQRMIRRIAPGIQLPGQDVAEHKIIEKLRKDGLSIDEAAAVVKRYQDMGTPITLADVGGENMWSFSRAALTPSTPGKNEAVDFLVNRNAGSYGRTRGALHKAASETGEHLNPGTQLNMESPFLIVSKAAKEARANAARPAYDRAFAEAGLTGVPLSPTLMEYLATPRFKSAYRAAYAEALNSVPPRRLPKIYDRKGKLLTDQINLEVLDAVKRTIGDKVYNGSIKGGKGSLGPDKLGSVKQYLGGYTKALTDVAPASYGQALAEYSDASKLIDAAKMGRQFSQIDDPATLADMLHTMTGAEKEHFLLGAVDGIRRDIRKAEDGGADVIRRVFGSADTPGDGNKQLILRQLFSKPGAYEVFEKKMKAEAQVRKTYDRMRGNSTTTAQTEALRDLGEEESPFLLDALTLNWKNAGKTALNRSRGLRGRNAEAAVPMLFNQNPMQVLGLLKRTSAALAKQAAKPSKVGIATGVGAGLLVPKTTTEENRRRRQ